MKERIEADEVCQGQRPDGMVAAQNHALVDVLGAGEVVAEGEGTPR
jgi:hypothetical protein